MKVSVCLATYNGEKYIEKQLLSILEQTCTVDEIVITDDCSTDNTLLIIDKIRNNCKDIKWLIVKNDIRLGFCHNFIKSIGLSTGDYVFLSDQDDIWEPNKVSDMVSLMDHNKDIDLLFSSYRCIDKNDTIIDFKYRVTNNLLFNLKSYLFKLIKYPYTSFVKSMNIAGMSMCIRRNCLDNFYKLDLSNIKYHDLFLALFASINDGLYFYNKELVNYRMHDDNTIGLNNAIGIKDDRIDWLKNNIDNQIMMKEYIDTNNLVDKFDCIKRVINFNSNRLVYLSKKCLFGLLGSIRYLVEYSSILSFFGDLKYIIGS